MLKRKEVESMQEFINRPKPKQGRAIDKKIEYGPKLNGEKSGKKVRKST